MIGRLLDALSRDPHGRTLSYPRWDSFGPEHAPSTEAVSRSTRHLARVLRRVGLVALLFGFLGREPAVAAFGTALLSLCLFAYREAWLATGAWRAVVLEAPETILEGESVSIRLRLGNSGRRSIARVVLQFSFEGALSVEQFRLEKRLRAGERRDIVVTFLADRGVGRYDFKLRQLVSVDALGLFPLAVDDEQTRSIQVMPAGAATAAPLPSPERGRVQPIGRLTAPRSGDSVCFLRLREWRTGDGARRIDWKRSARRSTLLVREFEETVAPDVTLLVDQDVRGHSEFGSVSTIKTLRETVISLTRTFIESGSRLQLVTEDAHLPLAGGSAQGELAAETALQLRLLTRARFDELLEKHLPLVPSESLAVLIFCSGGRQLEDLMPSLLELDARRVEVLLVVLDSVSFAASVGRQAQLESWRQATARLFLRQWLAAGAGIPGHLSRLLRKLPARTFILRPGEPMAELGDKK